MSHLLTLDDHKELRQAFSFRELEYSMKSMELKGGSLQPGSAALCLDKWLCPVADHWGAGCYFGRYMEAPKKSNNFIVSGLVSYILCLCTAMETF